MNKEQEKQLLWKQLQDKKEELKNKEKEVAILKKEIEELSNQYYYLTSSENLEVILDIN